ncbi:MAG TPA: sigma-70 family RNA polymerase sigma factor [Microthrixaceae bacterium]|nr:sigma-70 family RNA polymerase sigma factor [Microthrixaceae bacterium]
MVKPVRESPDEGDVGADVPIDSDADELERLHQVYIEVQPRLWRAILAWSGSTQIADDSVAEAFAQLARRGDAVRDPAAWAWRSAFRIAAGELAKRRARWTAESSGSNDARHGHYDVDSLEMLGTLESGGSSHDAVLDLIDALRVLSDQQRRAVVLVDGAGFTAPEAARLIGTTAATIRVQVMRARRKLRAELDPSIDHQVGTDETQADSDASKRTRPEPVRPTRAESDQEESHE